jgi:hypothetical protein
MGINVMHGMILRAEEERIGIIQYLTVWNMVRTVS